MININVVARISEDKNSFGELLSLLEVLKQNNINTVRLLFIGPIESQAVYQQIISTANRLGVLSDIAFTKKAVPIDKLDEDIKAGYFINFTVGNFIGYSALESIKAGLKTLCYNTDKNCEEEFDSTLINMCANMDQLTYVIRLINDDKAKMDKELTICNLEMVKKFSLNRAESQQLFSIISPQ
ncbi:hypothetical protein [Mucilaginibacter sp.]